MTYREECIDNAWTVGKEYIERMERRENRTNGEWNTEKTRVEGDRVWV